jgi:hypothetical protein
MIDPDMVLPKISRYSAHEYTDEYGYTHGHKTNG